MKLMSVDTKDIGKYNVSYMFGNFIQQIGIACGKAIGPIMYSCYKKNDEEQARKIIFSLQAVFLIMTLTVSIWLKEAFQILIKNDGLSNLYDLGILIVMSYSYRPMYLGANNRLFYLEKTKVLLKISLVAGLANVVMNIILIPYFGYEVAALTTYIALMYMGYVGYFLKDFKDNNSLSYFPIHWFLLTIIFTISAIFIVEMNIFLKVFINFTIFIILIFYLKRINK